MMKKFTLYLFFLAFMSLSANAQLADGTVAPDFTATDIDGNTHNLYSYLADGYTVIMDISATWCPPCWSYHETHALKDIHEQLGPDGFDKVIVLFIEGDASTTMADLEGTTGGTMGDWIDGTPYPIIDDASIATAYNIIGGPFPTIYKICPDGNTVYNIGQLPATGLQTEALSAGCGVASNALDAAAAYNGLTQICESSTPSTVTVDFMNLGSTDMTSATFDLKKDGAVVATEAWSGTLSTFASGTVDIDASSINDLAASYEVVMNYTGDEKPANNDAQMAFSPAPIANMLDFELEIMTDQYGYETYWEFRDESGIVHASGGNPAVGPNGGGAQSVTSGGYGSNSLNTETFSVPADGCYDLFMVDDWGDGICCGYGNGYFNLSDASGNLVLSGGQFAAYGNNLADVRGSGSTGIEALDLLSDMVLYPNPTSTEINVLLESSETADVQVLVTNAIGQVVNAGLNTTLTTGKQVFTLDVANLTEGLYFVAVQGENGQRTESFMIAR